ncbi:S1 family peptidase [Haladaptatus sp. DFWS20]|uniref:S1 family peptidase n=1 Tax=Haladaptatus sp. DFWS20 TaxID=3403467 RepID=UPI003EBB927C
MSHRPTRRQFLRSAGCAVIPSLASAIACGHRDVPATTDADVTAVGQPAEFSQTTRNRATSLGKTVQRSVVRITTASGGGTGWSIDDGYILTNSHIVRETSTVDIETFDERTGIATRVGFHRDLFPDIALLEIDIDPPPSLSMRTDAPIATGEPVLAVGHPKSVGNWVISLGRYNTYDARSNWIRAEIPTGDGNSGSPLLTMDGNVAGCINGTSPETHPPGRVDRPETVYTAYPKEVPVATATPAETIAKWLREWR